MGFSITGLNHLALIIEDIGTAKRWFHEKLKLPILEDRGELVFLLAGRDVIAIKTPRMATLKPEHGGETAALTGPPGRQVLDHYGFYAQSRDEVDRFADFLTQEGIEIIKGPYDRSDGRSVYFRDPCGLVGEYLYFQGAV